MPGPIGCPSSSRRCASSTGPPDRPGPGDPQPIPRLLSSGPLVSRGSGRSAPRRAEREPRPRRSTRQSRSPWPVRWAANRSPCRSAAPRLNQPRNRPSRNISRTSPKPRQGRPATGRRTAEHPTPLMTANDGIRRPDHRDMAQISTKPTGGADPRIHHGIKARCLQVDDDRGQHDDQPQMGAHPARAGGGHRQDQVTGPRDLQ